MSARPAPSGAVAEPIGANGTSVAPAVIVRNKRSDATWYTLAIVALLAAVLLPHKAMANALAAAGGSVGLDDGFLLLRVLLALCAIVFASVARFELGTTSIGLVRPATAASSHDRRELIALSALLLLAVGVRLNALDAGLWHDEIATLLGNVRPPLVAVLTSFESQNNHPLYSILAKLTTTLFGESAAALRLPAVLFGVASVAALYWFGVQLNRAREALFAAALLTVAYHHIWFSQNARAYTALLFFTLIGTGLFLRLCREPTASSRRIAVQYAFTMTLATYSHLTAALLVVGHAVVWLIAVISAGQWRAAWRSAALLAFALSALFSALLYAPGLPQIAHGLGGAAAGTDLAWKNPVWLLAETTRGLSRSVPGGLVSLAIAATAPAVGFISYLKHDRIVAGLMVVPVLVTALALLVTEHNLWPRFFFFAAGFAALILMRGVFALAAKQRIFPARPAAFVAATVLVAGGAVLAPSAWGPKQDFAAARAYVDSVRAPGDAVVVVGIASFAYRDYLHVDWPAVESETQLRELAAHHERVWLIYAMPELIAARTPELWRAIRDSFRDTASFPGTLAGGTIVVMVTE